MRTSKTTKFSGVKSVAGLAFALCAALLPACKKNSSKAGTTATPANAVAKAPASAASAITTPEVATPASESGSIPKYSWLSEKESDNFWLGQESDSQEAREFAVKMDESLLSLFKIVETLDKNGVPEQSGQVLKVDAAGVSGFLYAVQQNAPEESQQSFPPVFYFLVGKQRSPVVTASSKQATPEAMWLAGAETRPDGHVVIAFQAAGEDELADGTTAQTLVRLKFDSAGKTFKEVGRDFRAVEAGFPPGW